MGNAPRWLEAVSFAARAHQGHVRKDGRTPYIAHPIRVAMTVALEFGCADEEVVAAALLHDVLEDTTRDYDDVHARFGKRVADLVSDVSKDSRLPEAERERSYDERLKLAPPAARLIKLADVHDNLLDADGEESRRRLVEKADRALKLAEGDPELSGAVAIVRRLVEETRRGLGEEDRAPRVTNRCPTAPFTGGPS
jgi:guanosine-3',5'-bis(diphosphate) 3'-pyrophosphohydrolase